MKDTRKWKILGPDGNVHECENIVRFFEEHKDLIDIAPEGVAKKLMDAKRRISKSANPNRDPQWEGWVLLENAGPSCDVSLPNQGSIKSYCPQCGDPIYKKNVKYCSPECGQLFRKEARACAICGREFYCRPSSNKKTCSPECSHQLQRQNVTRERPVCAYCGKPTKTLRAQYCSYRCAGLAKQCYRDCAICGKPFPCSPSSEERTCGPECSKILCRRNAMQSGRLKVFNAVREKYVEETVPEDWQTAKEWTIRAPNGKVYELSLIHI